MPHEGSGHSGGASGWKIIIGLIAVIALAIYAFTQAKQQNPDGTARRPLDIMRIPRRIPVPSLASRTPTPTPVIVP